MSGAAKSLLASGFCERLREVRHKTGLNQRDFGLLAGISENTQTAYEKGHTSPTVAYLFELAAHDVDIGYVLTGRHHVGLIDSTIGERLGAERPVTEGIVRRIMREEMGAAIERLMAPYRRDGITVITTEARDGE